MGKNRWSYICVAALLMLSLVGCKESRVEQTERSTTYDGMMQSLSEQAVSEEITCWYTSDADQAFLENAAARFHEEYGITVQAVYYDGVNLFEDMNAANQDGTGPEVYLMGNDQLEFAKTSGMLEENTIADQAFWEEQYPTVATAALSFDGKQYGYPVYFDTYCLVYDANLLTEAPASIDEILAFLDEYEDTGSTKAVFRWDVADAYVNSMFLASYADLFGANGDDASSFSVNGEQCVETMQYFQSLSAYLWMDKSNISHDTVINRIQDGTLVLGLCKSDILPVLYAMQSQGETDTEMTETADTETTGTAGTEERENTNYQIAYVPSLTDSLSSTAWSTTYGAFVNPYGADEAAANLFALYLSYACGDIQYAGNGKLPVRDQGDGFDDMQRVLYAQYLNAKPVPKVMLFGDYLAEAGITFDAIWDGEDVTEQLNRLQTAMEEKMQ